MTEITESQDLTVTPQPSLGISVVSKMSSNAMKKIDSNPHIPSGSQPLSKSQWDSTNWDLNAQQPHGGQEWSKLLEEGNFIDDFSVTTNCLGPPWKAVASATASLQHIEHYPAANFEPALTDLSKFLAKRESQQQNQQEGGSQSSSSSSESQSEQAPSPSQSPDSIHTRLMLGNGASELIDLVTRIGAPYGGFKVSSKTQYKEYQRAAEADGRVEVAEADGRMKVELSSETLNPEPWTILAIVNPCNPTGHYKNVEEIKKYIEKAVEVRNRIQNDQNQQNDNHQNQNHQNQNQQSQSQDTSSLISPISEQQSSGGSNDNNLSLVQSPDTNSNPQNNSNNNLTSLDNVTVTLSSAAAESECQVTGQPETSQSCECSPSKVTDTTRASTMTKDSSIASSHGSEPNLQQQYHKQNQCHSSSSTASSKSHSHQSDKNSQGGSTAHCRSVVLVDESMQLWRGPNWREDSLISQPEWIYNLYKETGCSVYVIHSWTKIWSCPGIRLGSVVCPTSEHCLAIKKHQVPWSLNCAALAFLSTAIKDHEHLRQTWDLTLLWRKQTENKILSLFPHWKIHGEKWLSWLWIDCIHEEEASQAVKLCKASGCPIRAGAMGYEKPNFVRIAVRNPESQEALFKGLEKIEKVVEKATVNGGE